jgi:hypothetical protein
VAEVRRVLRPGGRFIVSTPDRDIYSPAGTPPNPYHVKELDHGEFMALLRRHFPHVDCLRQRPLIGSVMLGQDAAPLIVFDRPDPTTFASGDTLPRAPYIVAVASDRTDLALPTSVFIDRSDLDSDRIALAERSQELEQARLEMTEVRAATARALQNAQQAAELARQVSDARLAALARELDATRGSARTFLRHYVPRLLRHVFGTDRR